MKKFLFALTALASINAAVAQSSVTMYGVVDVSYGKVTGGDFGMNNGKGGVNTTNQSYHTPTRLGFRGTEDLGGGLKANFNLETGGIAVESGTGGNDFSREAWVGLSGTFGATRLGRTSSFGTQGHARYDLNGISTSSAMDNAGISPVTWYGSSRRSSQFQYVSPKFNGFDVGFAYVTSADQGGQSNSQFRANYDEGKVSIGLVTESKRNAASRTANALAGSYDFGVAKASLGFVTSETVAKGKGWHVGVIAPLGNFTLGAQYARNTVTSVKATEVFGRYNLSKRTFVYVDAVNKTNNANSYGVGLLHTF